MCIRDRRESGREGERMREREREIKRKREINKSVTSHVRDAMFMSIRTTRNSCSKTVFISRAYTHTCKVRNWLIYYFVGFLFTITV